MPFAEERFPHRGRTRIPGAQLSGLLRVKAMTLIEAAGGAVKKERKIHEKDFPG